MYAIVKINGIHVMSFDMRGSAPAGEGVILATSN